jgi:hypothetical protein
MDDLGREIGSWFRGLFWLAVIAVIVAAVLGTLLGLALAGVI